MSHFKIILETNPMICLCNNYPYQNTLEYKTNKRVGFQKNNLKKKCDMMMMNHLDNINIIKFFRRRRRRKKKHLNLVEIDGPFIII